MLVGVFLINGCSENSNGVAASYRENGERCTLMNWFLNLWTMVESATMKCMT